MNESLNIFADFDAKESRIDSNQDCGRATTAAAIEATSTTSPSPRPLWNGRKPLYELKAESPQHRAIIMMKASGMTLKEIAAALGYTAQHVMYVVKQPWAVEQILQEIERAGREPVLQLLKVSAMDAAQRLVSIAESAENDETRRKANNDILDRVFGKATQKMEVSNKSPNEFTDAELAAIAAQGVKN